MNTYKVHVITNKKVHKYKIEADNCLVRDNCYYFSREMEHNDEDKEKFGFSNFTVIVAMFPISNTIIINDEFPYKTIHNC